MEYPTLRRPKRKLCYVTNNERPSEQWTKPLSLEDVDKMFDDMDPTPTDDIGLLPDSSLHETFDVELNQKSKEVSSVNKEEHLTEKPKKLLLFLVTDSDLAFKAHGPIKTSSPVEKDVIVDGVKQLDNEDTVASPILFACEDEGEEEANHKPSPTQKPQNDDSGLESPVCTVTLSKPKMSSHAKKKEDKSGQEITELPVPAERLELEAATPVKKPETVHHRPKVEASTRKDAKSFLEKLRDAAQPEPVYSRKSLSPVAVPAAPVPEDDFLILEDDTPLWFSIPSKTVGSRQQKTSKTSSSDKDSSTDKEGKDHLLETVQKQPEAEQPDGKVGSQTVDQKMKKKKKKEVTEPANGPDEMSPEHLSTDDLMKPKEQANRKKLLQKAPSHESTKAETQAEDRTSAETKDKTPNLKMTKKPQKAADTKRTKSLKARNENTKKSKTKPSNRATEATTGSDGDKDLVREQRQKQTRMEPAVTEDFASSTEEEKEEEINDTEAQSAQTEIQTEVTGPSEEASAEDSLILGKRKRKPTGQWWLSCPVDTESAKVTDKQPRLKKSKKNDKEPSAAATSSPAKTKKQKVMKTGAEMQPSPSSRKITKEKSSKEKTNPAKSKKNKNNAAERLKASAFEEEEQQEALDQDLDSQPSSPLDLSHRDHNVPSGSRIFQKVYHPVSNGKLSAIPTPASPRATREQLSSATKTDKRKRKPTGSWWTNNGEAADVNDAVSSSQPQQQEAKPRKERKKQAKPSRSPGLGAPKNGNVSVSPVTAGGARPLKVKPVMAPKSLKRTLATFKDIFTSATETPPAVSSRETGEDYAHKVSACPPVEVTVTDFTSPRTTADPPSVDVYDDNHESQENSLKALRSGPSSMIELAEYDDDDNQNLPSSMVAAALSVSDLCGPPLKPLILQPKDKANLKEWFKSLWSTSVDDAPEITPEQFDWYFHQGRAIGFQVDQNCGTICSGKILLGSYMKKPLWVDHSATTVFNLLTSSVSVTINGSESRYHPGQAFMVPCGHAYSIQNTTSQPAVLYFTRVLAESSD
ncbi:uncharacterized protein V6R79_007819 [Siganus canaliculatus]